MIKKETALKTKVINYQNPALLARLQERCGLSMDEAKRAFMGMKQFLYIAATKNINVAPQSQTVDDTWHEFILLTEEYMRFCNDNFGFYIHHNPLISDDEWKSTGTEARNNILSCLDEEFGEAKECIGSGATCYKRCSHVSDLNVSKNLLSSNNAVAKIHG